jgi:hypothetical protein
MVTIYCRCRCRCPSAKVSPGGTPPGQPLPAPIAEGMLRSSSRRNSRSSRNAMSLRVFFFASLLICGLSFGFMDFQAVSGFQKTALPFLFVVTSLTCFVIALGWLLGNIRKWQRNSLGGRRSRSGGGDSSSGGGGADWPSSWSTDYGSGDCGGGGSCGGGGDGGGGGGGD